jgi:type I restriction enzyme M protein
MAKNQKLNTGKIEELLCSIYLYPKSHLAVFPGQNPFDAVLLRGTTGAPYLLAVGCQVENISAAIVWATAAASDQKTVGIIAIIAAGELRKAFRRRFNGDGWDDIPDIEYYLGRNGRPAKQALLMRFPMSHDLENLFFEMHSAMRDVDGVHADEALEELCKVIYTRSFEEDSISDKTRSPLWSESFGTTEEYAAAIRTFYKDGADYDLRVFRLKIPQYERSRGVFNQPIRLSSAALAKVYKMIEEFDLAGSRTDVKGRAFQKVLGRTIRSGMGQYFTPAPLCELMVEIAAPKASDLILDPFCGSAHFLTECLKRVAAAEGKETKAFHEFAFGKLHGIEKSERMVRVAMTDMRLSGDGHSNIRCTDALLEFSNYPDIAPESFDLVITNPPFGSLLGQEAFASLGRFELARGRKSVPLEILGLERAIQFLRPGGRLAILLPDNIFSADSTRSVRNWLLDRISPRVIISLPHDAFSPFGANVKTSILFARRFQPGETRNNLREICMIEAQNLGYDATGRAIQGEDLEAVATKASAFLEKAGW